MQTTMDAILPEFINPSQIKKRKTEAFRVN